MSATTLGPSAPTRVATRVVGEVPDERGATKISIRFPYMPGLDGLRAVAVAGVVLYHAELSWIPGGFLGVDVFFVISGYLITSLLLSEQRTAGRIALKDFWLRRARRLLPALFLMLAVVSVFALLFLPEEVSKLRGDVIAALTYSTNWVLIFRDVSYFEAAGRPSLLRHLWSLAVEEQFYILWPLIFTGMLRLWKGRTRPMLIAICSGALASTILMAIYSIARDYPVTDPSRVYYGTDTHAMGMLVGAALAIVWAPWRLSAKVSAGGRALLDLIGAVTLSLVIFVFSDVTEFSKGLYRGGYLLFAILVAALIAVAVHPACRVGQVVLGSAPLRWIGARSYGIYLWHWPIFMVTRPVLDTGITGTPNLLLRLALTVALAELSYRYVEMPIRQGALGRAWQTWQASRGATRARLSAQAAGIAGALALGIVLVSAGFAAARPAPPPPGFDVEAAAVRAANTTAPTEAAAPAPGSPAPAATTSPAVPGVPRISAIGDSVMLGAASALQQRLGDVYVDAAVSRQFGSFLQIASDLRVQGRLSPVVVVHAGTNGLIPPDQLTQLMQSLSDRERVVVVNLKVPRRWEVPNNELLAREVPKYPNAVLIDWRLLGGSHPEFFYDDGYHLRPDGARYYADLIGQQTSANP